MNDPARLPTGIVFRDVLLTLLHGRRRLLLTMLVIVVATMGTALYVRHVYQSNSSLLVLFSPEYSFRPTAGQQLANANSVEYEQILRTEANLLADTDLYRKVIKTIGIKTLYPKLLEPPGPIGQFLTAAKRYVEGLVHDQPPPAGTARAADIMTQAVNKFSSNLSIGVDRRSAIIRVSFRHQDPKLAAEALRLLESDYLAKRRTLLSDIQMPIVSGQEHSVHEQLMAADTKLQNFKREHDIANFKERQKILLDQQGHLETALAKTESTIAGLRARVAEVQGQVRVAAAQHGKGTPNAAAPLESVVSAYRRSEQRALTTYRGSPAVAQSRIEILKSLAELGKMRSQSAFKLSEDLDKSRADLTASRSSAASIRNQLKAVNTELASIDALDARLSELTRSRAVLDATYRSIAKIAGDRGLVEAVNARRQSSVRIVEPPTVPVLPLPTRRLILVAGLLIASMLGLLSALLPSLVRGVYLRPEALELDTGLAVLATVPEAKALASPVLLVVPK